jgi:hypothetical protein
LHWFNPLVWLADRRLRIECEQSSDDIALSAGIRPSDYARHLMEILLSVRQERRLLAGSLAMARKAGLERRLLAILDAKRERRGVSSRRAAKFSILAASLVVLLVVLRLDARAHDIPKIDHLPKGMTVEVIGLSTHPSGGDTWWRPDGTRLAEAPCDSASEHVHAKDRRVLEIVAKITGVPEGATLRWHPTQCMSRGVAPPQKGGKVVPNLQRAIAEFGPGEKSCSVHFDLAVGDWTLEQATQRSMGIEKNGKSFFFGRPREFKAGTTIAVAHNITDREVRVVAVDRNGKLRYPTSTGSGGAGHLMMLDVEFDMPPSELVEYQLQSRSTGRFEIKDVVLQPR